MPDDLFDPPSLLLPGDHVFGPTDLVGGVVEQATALYAVVRWPGGTQEVEQLVHGLRVERAVADCCGRHVSKCKCCPFCGAGGEESWDWCWCGYQCATCGGYNGENGCPESCAYVCSCEEEALPEVVVDAVVSVP